MSPSSQRRPLGSGPVGLLLPAAIALLLSAVCILVGFPEERALSAHGTAAAVPLAVETENAVRTRGCLACHRGPSESALSTRFAPVPAPDLRTSGKELDPRFLRRFLTDPQGERPGTPMPDLLAHLPAGERAAVIEDLVHFLGSRGGLFDRAPFPSSPGVMAEGAALFSSVGCRACHIDDDAWRTSLAGRTNVAALTAWLLDPAKKFPSGAMPSLRLEPDEARAIALHLLEPQAWNEDGSARIDEVPGLRYHYFEGAFTDCGPALLDARPVRSGNIDGVRLPPGHREDYFAVALEGEIHIPADGTWTFGLTSDDGSRLWIDGDEVLEHDGLHSPTRKEGTVELTAGWHPVRVTMFEYGGGQELALDRSGPGVRTEPVPTSAFRVRTTVHDPGGTKLAIDREKRRRGQVHYIELGCAACHDHGMAPDAAAPLEEIAAAATGCLAPEPAGTAPHFTLGAAERAAIVDWLEARSAHAAAPDDARTVDLALDRLSCRECHARDGAGGPTLEESAFFLGTAELGDEGRIPPDLTGVGAKLKRPFIEKVIATGASVRPYMVTRMPSYGAAEASALAAALHRLDGGDDEAGTPPFSSEAVEVGRALVGAEGIRCIDCHGFAGHDALGVPAIDLATLEERLQPRWYQEYMKDPWSKRPGTRMPAFWAEGVELFPDVLEGDADRQIDATWSYISLGNSAPLPPGLVVDRSTYDLAPVDEPIVFGAFFEGLSARTICCGYPERLSLAYDADHSRLAMLWRGEFMNARGTWEGRAGQLETPEGSDPIAMPPGDAITRLENWNDRWPETFGRPNGWRHRAVMRDAERRPVFRRSQPEWGVTVEESVVPRYDAEGSTAVRTIRVEGGSGLVLRLAVARSFVDAGDRIVGSNGVSYTVRGAEARVRARPGTDGNDELRVIIPDGGATIEVGVRW